MKIKYNKNKNKKFYLNQNKDEKEVYGLIQMIFQIDFNI